MTPNNESTKWLVCDPRTPVSEIAFLALSARLRPIPGLLLKAATEADNDTEHVHRIRVATRRAGATLKLFGPFAKKRLVKRIDSLLSTIRKAAGRARDLDVLIRKNEARQQHRLIETLRAERKRALKRIKQTCKTLVGSGKLKKQTLQLLRSMPREKDLTNRVSFNSWAHREFRHRADAFFHAWPCDSTNLDELHQFRIQAKDLRYVVELITSAFPRNLRDNLYPRIEAIQNELGELNDHVTACRKLDRWIARDDPETLDLLKSELAYEQDLLRLNLAKYNNKWTAEAKQNLELVVARLEEAK